MKRLLIIDGNAIVHRAFHAYPQSLTLPDGKPVNAIYGFFSILIKALEEVKPKYLVICFDRPAPTFRKQLYSGYQAQRPKMADILSEQIDQLHEALEMVGIPLFEIDGYEADDLIGTLAKQAVKNQKTLLRHAELVSASSQVQDDAYIEVIILSGDRDL